MIELSQNKEKVTNFFKHPSITYAAWLLSLFFEEVIRSSLQKKRG
jgi:hypothetical protein